MASKKVRSEIKVGSAASKSATKAAAKPAAKSTAKPAAKKTAQAAAAPAESSSLKVGAKAPAFSLKNTDGKTVKLADFKGKKVVLYFYPKDMTPGCTKEACSFRDDYSTLQKRGAVVLGVSADDQTAHQKFTEKYSLPFPLLSDPTHEMIEKYGAWGEKSLYGRKFMGILRITYIIDENGKVAHVFNKVKPETHAQDVLKVLEQL
ncbi:MAG: thioredoxin-dependent thiol peroxidase [Acidobacteria bacterium]|nr:thioredoxin-dependent thiol peroxidase [Acidobacteriota bacterium]